MIQEALARVVRRENLSREDAAAVMRELMGGEAPPSLVGAFLTALSMKGESVEEITGMAEVMRELATPIPATARPLVDTCGTGGDHAGTFNISTAAAFVVAGAGVAVAKHGNRSASSLCGSADVLESLGVNIEIAPDKVAESIDTIGIGFLFARALHTAMRHVGPIRADLKLRTVFNVLGPLTNPARADGQVMGAYDQSLIPFLAEVLINLGSRHVFVVAGADGLDELTLTGPSLVAEGTFEGVKTYEVTPEQLGLAAAPPESLKGGDAATNAAILRDILAGERGPRRDIVVLNAAPALVAGGAAATLEEGVQCAQAAIDSGVALNKLEELIRKSHDS
ncbi:MAG: anthranilate phosphoribosyltransferase [Candidatus Hydrogenedentes bacterium]|nr:anthranilate phosphoribosyltransferase [Candidatus Hydrogenedentota bacterium]